jgi:hypothetical protein
MKDIECGCCSLYMSECIKWRAVVNTVMNLMFTREAGNVIYMLNNCQRLKNSAPCI